MSEDQAGDDGEDLLRKHARLLQEEIGIPTDFLEGLVEERDDWSFVIKLTALIEGALTHLLTETLGRPELRDVFAFVDLGHTKAGKIVFASALNVLDPSAKTLIRKLLEMRNVFAHDVRSVALTIPEYARSLKPGEQKAVIKAFSYYTTGESIAIGKHPAVPTEQFTRENLRLAVWFSAMNLIAVIYLHKSTATEERKADRKATEVMERIITRLYSSMPPPSPFWQRLGSVLSERAGDVPVSDGPEQKE